MLEIAVCEDEQADRDNKVGEGLPSTLVYNR